ncbi:hypothetical protein F5Y16DRAFT_416852 [Xylariaceae sp. FL0255]|nr:hypothetical protein F5Y16DRAFT_416852 [Xylariaceae sp. FL0255]
MATMVTVIIRKQAPWLVLYGLATRHLSPNVATQADVVTFPFPATKLVVGQYFWQPDSSVSWAWYILGTFYDDEDQPVWSIEVLLGRHLTQESEPRGIIVNSAITPDNLYSSSFNHFGYPSGPLPYQPAIFEPSLSAFPTSLPISLDLTSNIIVAPPHLAMASQAMNGWSPRWGWDNIQGNVPAPNPPPAPAGMPFAAYFTNPGFYPFAMNPGAYNSAAGVFMPGQPQYVQGQPAMNNQPYMYLDPRAPQPHPRVSLNVPALNLVNSYGGAGCEPGYNYLFHAECTKIHVFQCKEPPWRTAGMNSRFGKFQVPTNVTLSELFLAFGACNPIAKNNKITEIIEGGNARWYTGQVYVGDMHDKMKKTLKEIGWDNSRNGRDKPVIWLWVTKD